MSEETVFIPDNIATGILNLVLLVGKKAERINVLETRIASQDKQIAGLREIEHTLQQEVSMLAAKLAKKRQGGN